MKENALESEIQILKQEGKNIREEDARKEMAVMQLSQILKDILTDKYLPLPSLILVTEEDKPYFKDLAVHSVIFSMQVLSKELNLPEDLKSSLILSVSDLERFLSSAERK